jgi:hypothetical protein
MVTLLTLIILIFVPVWGFPPIPQRTRNGWGTQSCLSLGARWKIKVLGSGRARPRRTSALPVSHEGRGLLRDGPISLQKPVAPEKGNLDTGGMNEEKQITALSGKLADNHMGGSP